MKKVGILTFHNAHNWGAALQVYALKTYLMNIGYDVRVINYKNKIIEENYMRKQPIKYKINGIKSIVKKLYLSIERLYSHRQYVQKWEKFNDFINRITDNQQEIKSIKEIEQMDLDYIICGSDQIWNYKLTNGFDKVYFCDFKTKALKISYAASMGLKELPSNEEKQFKKYLENFDYISVREKSLQEYIKITTDKDVQLVLDPTLLLRKEDYFKIEKKPKIEKYLFLYTLVDDKILTKISKHIAKKMNLKIVELRYQKSLSRLGKKQIANVGPEEFLGLINNADFVITNSFHGTVFSILFNKKFYTIPIKAVNSRIENLLKITNLQHRCIRQIEEVNLDDVIDYKSAVEKIEKEKQLSEEFLKKSLK